MGLSESFITIISILLGSGGIVYAVVSKVLDRKKYEQEVRDASATADIKGDEFWKNRYDVLNNEVISKDTWWKARYESLYLEHQNEKKLSNDIIVSFRSELNGMRNDYEEQREVEKVKYSLLFQQYRSFEEDSLNREKEYKQRISQLEEMLETYEKRLELR